MADVKLWAIHLAVEADPALSAEEITTLIEDRVNRGDGVWINPAKTMCINYGGLGVKYDN